MNIPFSPVWLWPVPVLLVIAAVLLQFRLRSRWMRLRERVEREGIEGLTESERRLVTRRRPLSLSWLLLVPALNVAMDIHYFSVPPIEGRVIDMTSGAPLAGVTVRRTMTRVGRYYLAEVPSSTRIGPVAECVTGADGEFAFPRWTALWPSGWKGMSGVHWVAYGPGLMPEEGCIEPVRDPFMASVVGCVDIGFGLGVRWTAHESRYVDGKSHLEVRLSRPDDQAAWEEAIRRIANLVGGKVLAADSLVEITKSYQATNRLTDPISQSIYAVETHLGGGGEEGAAERSAALALFRMTRDYCRESQSDFCSRFDRHYFERRESYLTSSRGE